MTVVQSFFNNVIVVAEVGRLTTKRATPHDKATLQKKTFKSSPTLHHQSG